MARIYLETSFVSACVTGREDVQSAYRRQASREWWEKQSALHEIFISEEVIEELSHPDFRNREKALAMIEDISCLPINDEVGGLARILVRERVMPGPEAAGDAVHVAVSTVYQTDYVLSWNVRHLANRNKVHHLQVICRKVGYVAPEIVTPDLLWEETP